MPGSRRGSAGAACRTPPTASSGQARLQNRAARLPCPRTIYNLLTSAPISVYLSAMELLEPDMPDDRVPAWSAPVAGPSVFLRSSRACAGRPRGPMTSRSTSAPAGELCGRRDDHAGHGPLAARGLGRALRAVGPARRTDPRGRSRPIRAGSRSGRGWPSIESWLPFDPPGRSSRAAPTTGST